MAVSLIWPLAVELATGAHGQSALPPSAAGSTDYWGDPAQVLFEQANYWRNRAEPARAIESLNRILTLGDNADALVMLAQIQAEDGDQQAALATLNRLRKAHPNDPRLAGLDRDLRLGPPDPSKLAEARALVRDGRMQQAVAAYQQAFRGDTPPERYAEEYFMTLGGTAAGFDPARDAIGRRVVADPVNPKSQLAYAELLTRRETSRAEGIERLVQLSQNTAVAEEADQALRDALLWLPDEPDSQAPVEAFLQRHPGDAELKQKLAAIVDRQKSPLVEAARARLGGFDDVRAERLDEAERNFQAALAINPQDADAMAGLGLVRLRQKRLDEGRSLLKQALDLGPTDAAGVKATLDATEGKGFDAAAARELKARYARVARLTRLGRYDDAERLLKEIAGPTPEWGNYLQLGDIQARGGKLREAEDSFRRALAMKPDNAAAKIGLAGVLLRQHRDGEAQRLYAQLGETRAIGQIQAERLRSQARRITDPVAQAGLYVAALKLEPDNPWLRLELARGLLRQGRPADARQVMEAVGGDAQGAEAAFYFAVEINDLPRAAALVERIPAGRRTPQMAELQQRVAVRAEIAEAAQSASPAQLRNRLLGLAAQPDPTGVRVAEIARALAGLNDRAGAGAAVETQLAAQQALTVRQRLAYAGALIGAGDGAEAERLLAGLEAERLGRDQARALAAMGDALAIGEADRLRENGRLAEAQDGLVRRLSADPANPGLNLALARVYRSRGQFGRAIEIIQAQIDRSPDNAEARRAAVDMMLAMGDLDRAKAIADESVQNSPGDPRALALAAEVARQRGEIGESRQRLDQARQIILPGAADQATETEAALAASFSGMAPNPFAGVGFPVDPLSRRIETEISSLDDQISPQIKAGLSFWGHGGANNNNGLGRLGVVAAPVEASFSPGGVGLMRVQVTPTHYEAATGASAGTSAKLFGTNPLQAALGGAATALGPQAGNGVGVNVAYNYRFVTLDLGATPLGFLRSNLVGGLQLDPLIGPDLRLRLTLDRRAVLDSAVAYAGARDPATGLVWGAVTRNRGYAQLEYSADRWFFYGGAGGGAVTGDNVRANGFVEAQLGASYALYRNGPQQFRAGLTLPYMNYAQNQNYFGYGQGGYFSPQNYYGIMAPFSWQDQPSAELVYKLTASVGFQSYQQNGALVFPNSPWLQNALYSAGLANGTVAVSYAGQHAQGVAGAAGGEFEYKISDGWRLGGRAALQKTGDYTEANGLIYWRYIFDKQKP